MSSNQTLDLVIAQSPEQKSDDVNADAYWGLALVESERQRSDLSIHYRLPIGQTKPKSLTGARVASPQRRELKPGRTIIFERRVKLAA